MTAAVAAPWYRYRAVWLLLLGPAVVVVAGIVTTIIAFRSEDGLVAEDYYKRGLAINRTLAREARAAAMHMAATLELADGRARVQLHGPADATPITLRFIHPARAARDHTLRLQPIGQGRYEAASPTLTPGQWEVVLEADAWRIDGRLNLPGTGLVTLRARGSP